jgi:hypothetical protein
VPIRTGEDDVLGERDPLTAGELYHLLGVNALGEGEIECVEGLELGEAGITQTMADGGVVARGLLDGETLV